jgi:hypothetical protein
MPVVGILGKIRRVGKDYVTIYVYAKYGGDELKQYIGSEVIGLIEVKQKISK